MLEITCIRWTQIMRLKQCLNRAPKKGKFCFYIYLLTPKHLSLTFYVSPSKRERKHLFYKIKWFCTSNKRLRKQINVFCTVLAFLFILHFTFILHSVNVNNSYVPQTDYIKLCLLYFTGWVKILIYNLEKWINMALRVCIK